ncbi:MAG: DUF853 family protein [Christensenellaceae bacterium]|jgi:stage III sporulation protein AA|nr:DUF853 family protein [Christensenellaceae bacterium]
MEEAKAWRQDILPLLPIALRDCLPQQAPEGLEELRIRVGRPTRLICGGGQETLVSWAPNRADCADLLMRLCRQSAYAYEDELRACYMTLPGGCRVGFAGRMSEDGLRLATPGAFNIRMARQVKGCAGAMMPLLLKGGIARAALLISAPGVGKTTALRDAARQLSEAGYAVCVADERGELAGGNDGVPMLDVGPRTDVLEGCKKARALRLLLRGMSPQVLVTDELFSAEDTDAVLDASGCGVRVLASAHAENLEDLKRRREIYALVEQGCFDYVLALRRGRDNVLRHSVAYAKEGLG